MGEFYKGGRRTYGTALLIVVVILAVFWLRTLSMQYETVLEFQGGRTQEESYRIRSSGGMIRFVYCIWMIGVKGAREYEIWRISYWYIVLPLGLISLSLLFTKPQKANQEKTPEPTANDGT